nr:immunoglobulin light chain junction region [Macaca mulatta]MPN81319.1 immunoglobulin light chain junction region [Macaca mulatta]
CSSEVGSNTNYIF